MADFGDAAKAWFEAKVRNLNAQTMQALGDAMEAGENITKHHIETRGTEGTGKRGRIDTGTMYDEVQHSVERVSADEAIGKFGWIGEKPFYALYQELGTQYIEPMNALSDAAEEVLIDYLNDMDGIVKNA